MKLYYIRNFIILFFIIGCLKDYKTFNAPWHEKYVNYSPDGNIELTIGLDNKKNIFYSINYKGEIILEPSSIGFEFKEQPNLDKNFKVLTTLLSTYNETWKPPWGESKYIHDNHHAFSIKLQETNEPYRFFWIHFKLFDDGVGFRYEFPKQDDSGDNLIITEEHSTFNLAKNHTAWWIPGDWNSYKYLYTRSLMSEIDNGLYKQSNTSNAYIPNRLTINTPITMKTEKNIYISIHEANLTDYADMTLEIDTDSYIFSSRLVSWPDGDKVKTTLPFKTPWRVILITDSVKNLLSSNTILNLNPPLALDHIDWIRPTKYNAIFWEMEIGKSGRKKGDPTLPYGITTENAKYYIDFASQNNIPALHIEGWLINAEPENFSNMLDPTASHPDFDIGEIIRYANEKNVDIIGDYEISANNILYEHQWEKIFQLYRDIGINKIKIGYNGTLPNEHYYHGQWMNRHYHKIIQVAAQHDIMIDVGEIIKPTGIHRTYPNIMTQSSIRDQTYNLQDMPNPPNHTLIIPFTSMLGGPMDYQLGLFDLKFDKYKNKITENRQVNTTLAKQLALYVIMYSPFQMITDLPENYRGHPAFEFIKNVPVDWESTDIIHAEIEEYITIVRKDKQSEDFFLGSITNQQQRMFTIELSFLEEGIYEAIIYRDGNDAHWHDNPYSIDITTKEVTKNDNLNLLLAPGGGQAIHFKKRIY